MESLPASALDLELFVSSVDAVADTAFVVVGPDDVVASWNVGAALITGIAASAAIGRRVREVLLTRDGALDAPGTLARAGTGGITTAIIRALGATFTVTASASPLSDGWVIRLRPHLPVASGVTPDRLHALLLPALREMVVMADLDGRVTYWNEAASTMLGYTPEERLGHHLFAFLPQDRQQRMAGLISALRDGAEWEGEYEATHKDGSSVWVEARAWALRDETGQPRALVTIAHDIRKRKRAETALAAREAAYQAAIETTGDGYWVVAPPDGRIVEVNQVYARYSGYTRDELLQMRISDIEALESQQDVEIRMARLVANGHDRFETWHRRKDGSLWPVEITTALASTSGLFHVFARDISERRTAEEALRASEIRLANAQQAARLGSWEWDPNTGQVWWSDAIRSMFGVEAQEPASFEAFLRVVHPEDQPRAIARVQAVMQGADGFADDLRIVTADGSVMWIDSRGRAVRDESGAIVRVEGTDHDITDRKRAEQALRDSEARFRNVLDGSPAVVYLKDFEGRYLFVNQTLAQIVGRPASEFVGLRAHDLFPHDIADRFDSNDGVVRSTLRPHQLEEAAVLPDGRAVTFLTVQFPLFREDGTPYAVCGISTDITDRKRAQAERDRLWNHSPDPLCVFDLDGYFTQVNPAWTERLGWSEAELLARPGRDLMHEDDLPGAVAALQRLRAGTVVRNFETRLRTRDGDWRWFSWNSLPVPDGHVHAFVRDVTDEKRLDEQIRQSQKIEAIGRLAGGVAHDFNNLLTVINGYTALLLQGAALQPSQREPLFAIRDAGDRAAALTAQLLAFGRKAMVEPKVLDINEVTTSSTRMLGRLIGEDVRLVTDLASGLPRVRVDPSQLDQVLVNLVVNARDAMPRGGLLRIGTALTHVEPSHGFGATDLAPGAYVRLSVSDTGAGIPADVRAHIFEPFYTTKGVGQGTGLGLATVYGIVRQAGGTVTVDSEPGHGSIFHVLLPAVPAHQDAGDATPQPAPAGGKESILIVEDEPGVRQLTRILLEAQGYDVHTADSAREALDVVASGPEQIDLLITDVVMPGMGGHQLAVALRERYPQLRVLFMSGYTDDAVLRHGVESSTDAFLQKPFAPDALARRVREVLDGSR